MRYYYPDELYHHGVKGQKWGRRRYQYEDGSLTAEGRSHYGQSSRGFQDTPENRRKFIRTNTAVSGVLGAGASYALARTRGYSRGQAAAIGLAGGAGGALGAYAGGKAGFKLRDAMNKRKRAGGLSERIKARSDRTMRDLEKELSGYDFRDNPSDSRAKRRYNQTMRELKTSLANRRAGGYNTTKKVSDPILKRRRKRRLVIYLGDIFGGM